MAAGRMVFPGFMPCEDEDGARVAGAKAYIFEAGAPGTPAPFYTTSALDVEHANPVTADASGVWPAMYADTTDSFLVSITDGEGVPLAGATWDDVTAAADAETAAVALAESAADRAEAARDDALNGFGTHCTSITSLAIGTGSRVFTLDQDDHVLAKGQRIVAASDANVANQMSGIISAVADAVITVTMDISAGAGTHADWIISLTGYGAVSSVAGLTGAVSVGALKAGLAYVKGDVGLGNVDNVAVLGKQALWIPAAALYARATNGAANGSVELSSNKNVLKSFDFDASTIEYVQCLVAMPKSWDEGTVTFKPVWSHAATVTNFKVSWGVQGVALSNDDASDIAFGTAQYSNDDGGTTNDLYVGPESSAITIAGTPAAEDVVMLQILRKADDGTNDTLAVDGRLHGIILYITTDAGNDA